MSGPGHTTASALERAGTYLAEVLRRSENERNFRIVCPDETSSNLLGAVSAATDRAYTWPVAAVTAHDAHLAPTGRVMEILSEHTCQGWLQVPPDRPPRALSLLRSLRDDRRFHGQSVRQMAEDVGRDAVAGAALAHLSADLRYLAPGSQRFLTPGAGVHQLTADQKGSIVRIYLPPDANSLVSTLDHCLKSTGYINLVIATKQPLPQWLSMVRRSPTTPPELPSGRGLAMAIQSGRTSSSPRLATCRRSRRSRRRRSCARSCPNSRCGRQRGRSARPR